MRWRDAKQKKSKCFVAGLLAVIALLTLARMMFGTLFYVNRTDSAPHGIYVLSIDQTLHEGDFVIAQLPMDVPTLRVSKGFLLLKQVQGFAGDSYEISDHSLIIKGRSYPIQHRKGLPEQEPGRYTIEKGRMLLLNEPEDSFDSRYWGTLDKKHVLCKVRLWIRFDEWKGQWFS